MSLIQRIPPLVSALAFGYGVGMAAPESTITSMEAAVTAYHDGARPPPGALAPGVLVAPPGTTFERGPRLAGESRELSKLRNIGAREDRRDDQRGDSCEMERPTHSRAPRYESGRDRDEEDVDDLDTAGVDALSRLQLPDLKIPVTRRVLKYVRFFTRTDRGRGMFETWLKRSGRYQDLVQMELRDRRLPEDLIWVAMIESGFDPKAKSPMGAMGLWQFMPATGAVYGLQQNRHLDQRKNPRLATAAAAHHLRDLYMRFGAWDLALAAYNMGYEQLLDRIDAYGTSDFNELARQQAIPSETASYVPKIAAAAIVANNLERFGFEKVEINRPVDAAEVAVPPGTPLKTLAKAAGVSSATVRTMNPDILGDRVPPGRGDFLLMIPADTLGRAQATLPTLLETETIVTDDASVLDPVDLLGGRDRISRRRARGDDESLLSLLPPPKRRALRDPMASRDDDAADDEGDDVPFEPRRLRERRRSSRESVLYKVGPGETLLGLARRFAVDIDDVARDNRLDADAKLREGALVRIKVRRDLIDADERPAAGDEPLKEKESDKAKARSSDSDAAPAKLKPSREPASDSPVQRDAPLHKKEKKEQGAAPSKKQRSQKAS